MTLTGTSTDGCKDNQLSSTFEWTDNLSKKETRDSSSSLPTVCSSSNGSIASSEKYWKEHSDTDTERKSWSTGTQAHEELNPKFSYKEILLMNDFATGKVPIPIEPKIVKKTTPKSKKEKGENGPLVPRVKTRNNVISASGAKDYLQYTREHTNGKKFTRLGGHRMDTTIIREAISQAVSQGKISKSVKRELRQSLLRGDTSSVLEGLRRECHLCPVVPPIDNRFPSEYELRNTNGMMKCVNQYAPLQDSDELAKKHIVLVEVERIIDEWVKEEAERYNRPDQASSTFLVGGSWYLKVDTVNSDLDVVVLVPRWITVDDYLTHFKKKLQERNEITELHVMDDAAQVAGLTFAFSHVKIDLLLTRFTQNHVPKSLPIHSDHILCGMDEGSVKSLAGPRVAAMILDLVPNPSSFRTVLQAVRFWAKRRGLYSSRTGFLGGISWSVMVAFICQMLPKATPSSIFHHFFTVFSAWKWPTPVLLSKPYDAGLGCKQWCPRDNVHERSHVMPIITPGYPAVNSATNVNFSTLRVLQEEFTRGKIILDGMMMKGLSSPGVWNKLFEHSDFCIRYNHYLVIDVSSLDNNIQFSMSELVSQFEFIVRKLVVTLQHTPHVLAVHPFPDALDLPSTVEAQGKSFYIGFEIAHDVPPFNAINSVIKYFLATEIQKLIQGHQSLNVEIQYLPWNMLPENLFAQGKQQAAGERAKFVLRQAHEMHIMNGFPVMTPQRTLIHPLSL